MWCVWPLALLKGKSYNRGVRAHKLIMEAFFLLRLQWQATGKWLEKEREDHRLEGVAMRVLAALQVLEQLF